MNTIQLKAKFPQFYEELFFTCTKVASAPHSFFWTGDFSHFFGGLAILSKIPFRFYVGLEKNDDEFDVDNQLKAYFPYKGEFINIFLDSYIVDILREELRGSLKGYKMKFMTELSLGLSVGGLGAMVAAISMLVLPSGTGKQREAFCSKLIEKIQRGRKSPATAFTSLSEGALPIVFYSSERNSWARPISDVFSIEPDVAWPIDFGLIFSGNLVQGSAVIASTADIEKKAKALENLSQKVLNNNKKNFWQTYLDMLNQIACQTLVDFKSLFVDGSVNQNMKAFFDEINQYQNLLYQLDISTNNIDRLYSAIHGIANKQENGIGSGAKISGVGKGGEVLFALNYGQYREKIEKMVGDYAKKNNQQFSLDYASWRDGFEVNSTLIEQDLEKNIYSNFTKKATFKVEIFSFKDSQTKFMNSIEDLKDCEIILDKIKNKILISGNTCDSTQLPSQKATILILEKILKSKDYKLTNSHLEKSYGKSRFDLQSKIALPLQKLSSLNFEITGDLYSDFSIKLKSFGSKIAIVQSPQ